MNLSRRVLKKVSSHAESTYPEECCGLLVALASNTTVTEAVPMKNSAESKTNRYFLDPMKFIRADQSISKRGKLVVGIYHSHPDHPAAPSEYDREHAIPNMFYLILSVSKGKAKEAGAWILADDQTIFNEEPVRLLKDR
jgi:proteasome lid subunit RPN8/RPN11